MRIAPRVMGWIAPLAAGALFASPALAQDGVPSGLDSGDTAWILTCSALVLMMTVPGLALFYGGLVRAKNTLSVFMQCLTTLAIVSVIWVLWGYSIAFGPDLGGLLGDPFAKFGLTGVSYEAGPDENIPEQAFMIFQLMFAAITPALIVGAFAERMKFSAFFLFTVAWSTFIYAPLAHWVWAEGGWLFERGALDFAGGTVVHISSGTSALIAAAMIGLRRGYGHRPMAPHHVPFTVVGAGLLWVGWFGFNAGSALASDGTAVLAFVNTNTATGAAVLGWTLAEWVSRGRPTVLGAATGAVAGLVAITPACGFVSPLGSIAIGAIAGVLCYRACNWKDSIGYDDALDVVGVHGVGGTWGAIATGFFATEAGLFATGDWGQVWTQVIGVFATYAFAGFGTFVILGLVNATVGLRVDDEDEETGLDLSLHSESAYSWTTASPIGEPAPVSPQRPRPRREAAPAAASGGVQRTPPRPSASPAPAASPSPAPSSSAAASAPGSALGEGDRPFRIVIDGIDKGQLQSWWRGLCHQDISAAPQAFRDIYPNVVSFEGNTYRFRGGDAAGTRDRIAYLLDIYGAHGGTVRIEQTA